MEILNYGIRLYTNNMEFNLKKWAQLLGTLSSQRASLEVKLSSGSGIRGPRLEFLRIELRESTAGALRTTFG